MTLKCNGPVFSLAEHTGHRSSAALSGTQAHVTTVPNRADLTVPTRPLPPAPPRASAPRTRFLPGFHGNTRIHTSGLPSALLLTCLRDRPPAVHISALCLFLPEGNSAAQTCHHSRIPAPGSMVDHASASLQRHRHSWAPRGAGGGRRHFQKGRAVSCTHWLGGERSHCLLLAVGGTPRPPCPGSSCLL